MNVLQGNFKLINESDELVFGLKKIGNTEDVMLKNANECTTEQDDSLTPRDIFIQL